MEQASGSILTGIRAFSALLPLTSLILLILLFYYSSNCCRPLLIFGSSSTFRLTLTFWLFWIKLKISPGPSFL